MPREIKESDWQILRQVKPVALERYCRRVLEEIDRVGSEAERSYYERYLSIDRLIERHGEELALTFDDHRRSTALLELTAMYARDLLTEEEFARFSPETREVVLSLTGP